MEIDFILNVLDSLLSEPLIQLAIVAVGALVANFIWDTLQRPRLKVQKIKNDEVDHISRYAVKIKNKGRGAAVNCRAELYMTGKNDTHQYRISQPLGWVKPNLESKSVPQTNSTVDIYPKTSKMLFIGYGNSSNEVLNFNTPSDSSGPNGFYKISLEPNTAKEEIDADKVVEVSTDEEYDLESARDEYIEKLRTKDEIIEGFGWQYILLIDKSEEYEEDIENFKETTWEEALLIIRPENAPPKEVNLKIMNDKLQDGYPMITKRRFWQRINSS